MRAQGHLRQSMLVAAAALAVTAGVLSAQTVWTRSAANPVLPVGSAGRYDAALACDAWVLKGKDGRYEMWYTAQATADDPAQIAYAWSPDGMNWRKQGVVLGAGSGWDAYSVQRPCVIVDRAAPARQRYKMWYTGTEAAGGPAAIGFATSPNGKAWTRQQDSPVLRAEAAAGSPAALGALVGTVMRQGEGYTIWYAVGTGNLNSIYRATSPDGVVWSDAGLVLGTAPTPVAGEPLPPDALAVQDPSVLFDGTLYHMWYTGLDLSGMYSICYAFSADGITWERSPSNPVVAAGDPDAWDEGGASDPVVLLDRGVLRMWYTGCLEAWGLPFQEGYATGVLGDQPAELLPDDPWEAIAWLVSQGMLNRGQGRSLTAKLDRLEHQLGKGKARTAAHELRAFANHVRALVAGGRLPLEYGQALLACVESMVPEEEGALVKTAKGGPGRGLAAWPTPNPFNPNTHIQFALTEPAAVTLRVYDIQGRLVASLLAGQPYGAGQHAVEFDGSNLSSGLYFFRLEAGGTAQVGKLTLLK